MPCDVADFRHQETDDTMNGKQNEALLKFCAFSLANLLILVSLLSGLATGDGMSIYSGPEHPREDYEFTWETRQLAAIRLLNDTHEEMSLFLSVNSLTPGQNLSILVPFKTRPVSVTGAASTEDEFKEKYYLDRIPELSRKQDWEKSQEKFGEKLLDTGGQLALSTLATPGAGLAWEYLQGNYDDSSYGGSDSSGKNSEDVVASWGGGGSEPEKPKKIGEYDFEGMSVDVFDTSAGFTLSEFLEFVESDIPEETGEMMQNYLSDYIAVVNASSRPPIPEEDFALLTEVCSNTIRDLKDAILENPTPSDEELVELANNLHEEAYKEARNWRWEIEENDSYRNTPFYEESYDVRGYMENLVYAVFGRAHYSGFILTVSFPLVDDQLYFPLGTSVGWLTPIWETKVAILVPEDKKVKMSPEPHFSCYLDGHHLYMVSYDAENPSEDLYATVETGSEEDVKKAEQVQWFTENGQALVWVFYLAVLLLVWQILVRLLGIEGREDTTLSDLGTSSSSNSKKNARTTFLLLGGLLLPVISIWGGLLLLLFLFPSREKEWIQPRTVSRKLEELVSLD